MLNTKSKHIVALGMLCKPSPSGMGADRDETQGVFCSQ